MTTHLSQLIFESLVVSLLFSALCLMQITELPSLPCANFGGVNITTVHHDGAFTIRGAPLYWIALLVLRFTAFQKRVVSDSLTTNHLVIVH